MELEIEELNYESKRKEPELDYHALNAEINLLGPDGNLQLGKDKEAAKQFFLQHVNMNTVFFHKLEEKLEFLVDNDYYEEEIIERYPTRFVKDLFKRAYSYKFRFNTFLGAFKYYSQYTLKTFDQSRYLERFEDRVVMNALYLGNGDTKLATDILDEIMTGRYQPATPTFLNAGKKQRGEMISCFPAGTPIDTPEGRKAIEKLEVGDLVLSHDGTYNEVEELIVNPNNENLVAIGHYGDKEPIVSTPNHPILVWTERDVRTIIKDDGADAERGFVWLEAKDIETGDYLVMTWPESETKYVVNDLRVSNSKGYKILHDRVVYKVSSTEILDEAPAKVYNLEVKNTHTYSVRGAIVHNCFLIRTEDNMESIGRTVNSALQLSKRGGGVGINLTNLREVGAPIKNIENQSSGIVPVMKILEDTFSYANQLGARQGAGAVYLNVHHPDILLFLDTKRENADEKIRIKTLSLGLVVPDITFELAKRNEDMYLFSPYDVEREYGKAFSDISVSEEYYNMVENPRINKKKISARKLFSTIAEIQMESGYPYLLFEDTANRSHNLDGRINMSNLCSEILQLNTPSEYNADGSYKHIGKDISCNLGSLNIYNAFNSPDFEKTIETSVRALTAVSDFSDIQTVPSIKKGNQKSHAIGLGQMNLHGFLASNEIFYDSPEAVDFSNIYAYTVLFYAMKASNKIAKERGETFHEFKKSKYATGEFFNKYIDKDWSIPETEKIRELFAGSKLHVPTVEDWVQLKRDVMEHGLYNAYLLAIPPTGSISYINNSTASIHPVNAPIEKRKEGMIGRVYHPAFGLNNDNIQYYKDAFAIGPDAIINIYSAFQEHTDQGLSCTLFFKDTATTRDLNKAYIKAWTSGLKTLYYIRIKQDALSGTEVVDASGYCESCML